jgi:large subunit ribosomal protein L4
VAAPKAPLLDAAGKASKQVTLEAAVFAADVKPHLVHETVRAEMNATRAGTRALKSRGLVAGGRAKPWRQKGTGRARAGTIRAPQFTGGGAAFQVRTVFDVKVNRKERRAAFRSALSAHASGGSLGLVDGAAFDAPSTKRAAGLLETWG